MIDNNRLEKEVMALIKKGEKKSAHKLQDKFLEEVKNSEEDHCNCPTPFKHHGNCVECVIIHRGHGDHLPYFFRNMVSKRIEVLSGLTEHSFKAQSKNE